MIYEILKITLKEVINYFNNIVSTSLHLINLSLISLTERKLKLEGKKLFHF